MANITDPRISDSTIALLQAIAQDSTVCSNGATAPTPFHKTHKLSFIVTVLNEREAIQDIYTRIAFTCSLRNMSYEIIYVDKGSTDGSWEEITRLSLGKHHICPLKIRPESNHAQVLAAGSQYVNGDILFTMKAGTDNAGAISRFIAKMEEGYDVVYELSESEKNRPLTRILAGWSNWLTGRHSHLHTSYVCYSAKMIRHLFRTTRLQEKGGINAGLRPPRGCRICEIEPRPGIDEPAKKAEYIHTSLWARLSLNPRMLTASIGASLLVLCLLLCANGTATAPSPDMVPLLNLSVFSSAALVLPRPLSSPLTKAISSRCKQPRKLNCNCVEYRHEREMV
ncbi:MAG: glycosyltransferase [Candidatus Methylacidiphilales bacterium]|nr:glycosyltransferase [Candidatus Methylacidiphilales bacterium]